MPRRRTAQTGDKDTDNQWMERFIEQLRLTQDILACLIDQTNALSATLSGKPESEALERQSKFITWALENLQKELSRTAYLTGDRE